jgi:hypothetical protein
VSIVPRAQISRRVAHPSVLCLGGDFSRWDPTRPSRIKRFHDGKSWKRKTGKGTTSVVPPTRKFDIQAPPGIFRASSPRFAPVLWVFCPMTSFTKHLVFLLLRIPSGDRAAVGLNQ